MNGHVENGDMRDECEGCGRTERPVRSILMKDGGREQLCKSCFFEALDDDRVAPSDPRVETMGGAR